MKYVSTAIQEKFNENFVKKTITREVYHLTEIQEDVVACKSVPDELTKEMFKVVVDLQKD